MGMPYGCKHYRGIPGHSSSMHCVTRPTHRAYYLSNSNLIAAYTEQPETVQYPDGNRLRHYTPDFELFLADGSSALIEIKHELDRIAEHFTRIRRMRDRVSLWLKVDDLYFF